MLCQFCVTYYTQICVFLEAMGKDSDHRLIVAAFSGGGGVRKEKGNLNFFYASELFEILTSISSMVNTIFWIIWVGESIFYILD